jgi:hypothetical protein
VLDRPEAPSEERALYVVLALVGVVLLVAAIATRGPANTGGTLGLGFTLLAAIGLGSQLRAARRARLPRARARVRQRA